MQVKLLPPFHGEQTRQGWGTLGKRYVSEMAYASFALLSANFVNLLAISGEYRDPHRMAQELLQILRHVIPIMNLLAAIQAGDLTGENPLANLNVAPILVAGDSNTAGVV